MKKSMSLILLGGLTLGGIALIAQDRYNHKFMEYGILEYGTDSDVFHSYFSPRQGIFAALSPPSHSTSIDSTAHSVITGSAGTKVSILPDSFVDAQGKPYRGKVNVHLTEIVQPIDFILAGMDMTFRHEGKESYFKSGGMFGLAFFGERKRLQIVPGRYVEVQFPDTDGQNHSFYKFDKKAGWQSEAKPPRKQCHANVVAVGSDGIFNFDSPYPYVACLKGVVKDPRGIRGDNLMVMMVGVSFKGYFSNEVNKDGSFEINVHKNEKLKLVAIDSKGNIAMSKVLTGPSRNGFHKDPEGPKNYKEYIGEIILTQVSEDIKSDKVKLQDYLGLSSTQYRIECDRLDPDDVRESRPQP